MWGRAIAALGLVSCVAGMAAGQERVGPEFRVNAYTTNHQSHPQVAADPDGNFVLVWQSRGQVNPVETLVGRRYDRMGVPRGGEFIVSAYTTNAPTRAAVSIAPSGPFVVAWQSSSQTPGHSFDIFVRRFDEAGAPLDATEIQVNNQAWFGQTGPDVAHFADGGFVVVWQNRYNFDYEIFGQRFDAAGSPHGPQFQVNAYSTERQDRAAVAATPDGGFVVAWHSRGQDGDGYGVFARRFDPFGNPLAPEFVVSASTTGDQEFPVLATDGTGGFAVAWTDSSGGDDQAHVVGRVFDSTGVPGGGEFPVSSAGTSAPADHAIAREPGGAFVVAWASWNGTGPEGSDGSQGGIFQQRFDPAGALLGPPVLVNRFTTSEQRFPAVASLGAEKFVVTWDSYGQDGHGSGVFAQRFGDLLFRDGFETGDTSRWAATASDSGDLGVSVGAAMKSTTFGMQLFADDTNGLYVQDDTPQDENAYGARFYFNPGDFDPGESVGHRRTRIFIGFEEAPNRRLFALILRRIDGQYSLMGRVRLDDDTRYDTGFFPITAAPHFVEFRWSRPTLRFANGSFSLQVDGTQLASTNALDNDISRLDFVRMGALSVKTGAAGTLYFDEFESRRELPIGP